MATTKKLWVYNGPVMQYDKWIGDVKNLYIHAANPKQAAMLIKKKWCEENNMPNNVYFDPKYIKEEIKE